MTDAEWTKRVILPRARLVACLAGRFGRYHISARVPTEHISHQPVRLDVRRDYRINLVKVDLDGNQLTKSD